MITYSANAIVGLFGRSPASLDSLRTLINGHAEELARAGQWLASESQYILHWQAVDGRIGMLFSDDEEQLLTQSLEQVMGIENQPKETLLVCFTYTPVDASARKAWSAMGGAVTADDQPMKIGSVRIGP
jgi:hypothetical protein